MAQQTLAYVAVTRSDFYRWQQNTLQTPCTKHTKAEHTGTIHATAGNKTVGLIDNSHSANPVRAVTVHNNKRQARYIG